MASYTELCVTPGVAGKPKRESGGRVAKRIDPAAAASSH